MTTDTAILPTIGEMDLKRDELVELFRSIQFHQGKDGYAIDDYPIGGRNRGRCRLAVDRRAQLSYRTARTTTSKHGEWCKPKKSTYREAAMGFVVSGLADFKHDAAWLHISRDHVSLNWANGGWHPLWPSPFGSYFVPHRHDRAVGGTIYPADSPDRLAVWDHWTTCLKSLMSLAVQLEPKGQD